MLQGTVSNNGYKCELVFTMMYTCQCDRARQNLGGIDVQVALCKARCRVKRLLMGIDTLHKTTFVSAGHGFNTTAEA